MRKVLTVAFLFSLTTVAQCAVIGYHMEEFVDKYGRRLSALSMKEMTNLSWCHP